MPTNKLINTPEPVYGRLRARRDKLAKEKDRTVTFAEVLEIMLDQTEEAWQ